MYGFYQRTLKSSRNNYSVCQYLLKEFGWSCPGADFLKSTGSDPQKTTRILIRPNFDLIKFFDVFQNHCNLFIIGIDQVRVADPGEFYPGSDPGSDRKNSNPDSEKIPDPVQTL